MGSKEDDARRRRELAEELEKARKREEAEKNLKEDKDNGRYGRKK